VEYITDYGQKIVLRVSYRGDNYQQRLNIGGFDFNAPLCFPLYTRSWIVPRAVDSLKHGLIYFKTHELFTNYLKKNPEDIKQSRGEVINRKFYKAKANSNAI
jgi:hypothetical protein